MLQLKILLQQRSKISKILWAETWWSQINQCFLKICRVWGLWGHGERGRDQGQKWLSGFWLMGWGDVGVIFRDWEPEKMWKVLTGTAKVNLGSSCWKWCWFQPGIFPHFQLAHSLLSLGIYLNVCISAKIFLSTFSGIWCHPHPCVLHCLPWLYSFFFFFYHIYHHLILLLIYVMVSHHYKVGLMRASNCVHFVLNLEQYQVSSQHSGHMGSLNEWMNGECPVGTVMGPSDSGLRLSSVWTQWFLMKLSWLWRLWAEGTVAEENRELEWGGTRRASILYVICVLSYSVMSSSLWLHGL